MPDDRPDPFSTIEEAAARQAAAEQARRALSAARARLVLGRDATSAFFACLALRLVPEADESVGTMATDGRTLSFRPGFVNGLTADELVGVVAHEVMHNALAHSGRLGARGDFRRRSQSAAARSFSRHSTKPQASTTWPPTQRSPGRIAFLRRSSSGSMPSFSAMSSILASLAKAVCGLPKPRNAPVRSLLVYTARPTHLTWGTR